MSAAKPVLPRWATLDAWLALLGLILALRFVLRDFERYRRVVDSEQGLVENLTVAFALLAAALCLAIVRRRRRLPQRWLGPWFLLCALGCALFAGEESSWGQHWFGWSSPQWFAERNRQGETNLHNLGKYSTQRLPKLLLTAGIVGGGLALPLWRRARRRSAPASLWLPGDATVPLAGLVLLTRLLERLRTWLHLKHTFPWDIHFKETNEMLMAGFFAVYALAALVRSNAEGRAISGPGCGRPAGKESGAGCGDRRSGRSPRPAGLGNGRSLLSRS